MSFVSLSLDASVYLESCRKAKEKEERRSNGCENLSTATADAGAACFSNYLVHVVRRTDADIVMVRLEDSPNLEQVNEGFR